MGDPIIPECDNYSFQYRHFSHQVSYGLGCPGLPNRPIPLPYLGSSTIGSLVGAQWTPASHYLPPYSSTFHPLSRQIVRSREILALSCAIYSQPLTSGLLAGGLHSSRFATWEGRARRHAVVNAPANLMHGYGISLSSTVRQVSRPQATISHKTPVF